MAGFKNPSSSQSLEQFKRRTGALGETYGRTFSEITGNIAALVSGTVYATAIPLGAGVALNKIAFKAGSTGAGVPTHQFAFIANAALQVQAVSADLTNTAWAAQTEQQFTLTAPFTPAASGLFYVGLVVVATGVPTIDGITAAQTAGNNETDLAPVLAILGDAGQTTPALLPATITQSAFSRALLYAWVS